MKNIIADLVRENVWTKIRLEFKDYILKHFDTLNEKEQDSFLELMKVKDSYSTKILERLWVDFEITACTEVRIQKLFAEELKKFGLELTNKI